MPRQSRRLTLLLRALWFFLFGATLFGSLSTSVGPPALFPHADKLFHFGAWGALSALAFLVFAGRYNRFAIPSALLVISAATLSSPCLGPKTLLFATEKTYISAISWLIGVAYRLAYPRSLS